MHRPWSQDIWVAPSASDYHGHVPRPAVIGALLSLGLVVIGLAGADKPPPPGFLLWVLLAAAAGVGVWRRGQRWRGRVLPGVRDGAIFGASAGFVLAVFGGEPTVEIPWWGPVVLVVTAAGAGAVMGGIVSVTMRTHGAGGGT